MAIDTDTKLLPCPFCGNPNVLFRDVEYDRTLWIIECNQCHMEVAAKHKDLIHGRKSTHDDLVIGWNRRTEETPLQPEEAAYWRNEIHAHVTREDQGQQWQVFSEEVGA